jgi:glycosyltransferase involved in cell wall biosynthesis
VVSTAVGELPVHVRDNETGWLVAAGDRNALADALIDSLSDRVRTAELGRASLTYAHKAFDWDRSGSSLYEGIVVARTSQ